MTEDVTLVGVREEDVEGRVWVQMRPPKGTMMLVCLRKWKSGRMTETESTDHRCFLRLGFGFLGLCKVIWLLQRATNTHWYILEVSLEAQAVRITVSTVAETKICFGRHCVWAVIPTDLLPQCENSHIAEGYLIGQTLIRWV